MLPALPPPSFPALQLPLGQKESWGECGLQSSQQQRSGKEGAELMDEDIEAAEVPVHRQSSGAASLFLTEGPFSVHAQEGHGLAYFPAVQPCVQCLLHPLLPHPRIPPHGFRKGTRPALQVLRWFSEKMVLLAHKQASALGPQSPGRVQWQQLLPSCEGGCAGFLPQHLLVGSMWSLKVLVC